MTFDEYHRKVVSLAVYPNVNANLVYPLLGLNGEAGEVAEKVKKLFRDKGGVLDDERRMELAHELGDVLWYVSACANELGFTLEQIADMNIEKLESRKARGTIHGDGDAR